MSRSPVQGRGLRGLRSLTSKKVILTAVLMVAVLTVSCFVLMNENSDESDAAYADSVWVNGRNVTSGNTYSFTTGSMQSKVMYDSTTGTLTLQDISWMYGMYEFSAGKYANIYSSGDLNIVFAGAFGSGFSTNHTINIGPNDISGATHLYGIYVGGRLTITSEITSSKVTGISISAGKASTWSVGVYSEYSVGLSNINQKLTLRGGTTSYGSDVETKSTFLNAGLIAPSLTISNCADVDASAKDFIAPKCEGGGTVSSYGIDTNLLTITNSNVTAKSGAIDSTYYVCVYPVNTKGINCEGKFTITDSGNHTVTATAGDVFFDHGYSGQVLHGGGNSYGIYADSMENNGGTVTATGGVVYLPVILDRGHSYGICVGGSFVGNGGTLTATGSDAAVESGGMIIHNGNFTGKINATCTGGFVASTTNTSYSFGLKVNGNISLTDGSRVQGYGGTICYRMYSVGVEVKNITLSGSSELTGRGGDVYDRYTTTTKYKEIPFVVTTGSSSDSYGIATWGSVTVNTDSILQGYGGSVTESPSGGGSRISSGLHFMGNGVDGVNVITGDGTGIVDAAGGNNPYGHGIYDELDESIGISTRGSSLRINGTTVWATGGDVVTEKGDAWDLTYYYAQGSRTTGIQLKDLILENHAVVYATGGQNIHYPIPNSNQSYVACHNDSFGLYLKGSLTVTDSVLEATANDSLRMIGILIEGGGITVNGDSSVVNAIVPDYVKQGSMNSWENIERGSWGIYLHNFNSSSLNITMNSGKLDAEGYTKAIMSDTGTNTLSALYVFYGDIGAVNMRAMGSPVQFSYIGNYHKHISTNYRTYTLSFNANGGSGTMDHVEGEITHQLPGSDFTAPAGKHFVGWSKVTNGGLIYPRYNNFYIGEDTTLYAVWENHSTQHVDAVAPTCTEIGHKEHWYCEYCRGAFSNEAGTIPIDTYIPPLEHDLEKSYDWADDGSTCTVDATCSRCGHKFHKVLTAEPSREQDPDCTEKGATRYDVGEYVDGEWFSAFTILYDVPALGHTLGQHVEAVPHTCEQDGHIEYWTCSVCGWYFSDAQLIHEISLGQTVDPRQHSLEHHVYVAETCTTDGHYEYWHCIACDKYFIDGDATGETQHADIVIHAHHELEYHTASSANCTTDGHIAHYQCTVCHKYFADSNADTELQQSDVVILAHHQLNHYDEVEETCTADGHTEYWQCTNCSKYFADNGAATNAHTANELTWEQIEIAAHHTMVHHDAVQFTCTSNGQIEYWHCSACGNDYSDANGNTEIDLAATAIPAHHVVEHHAAVSETCTQNGNSEYWKCTVCGKCFSDSLLSAEISEASTVIQAHHTSAVDAAVAPNCTDTGLTEGSHCSVCHVILVPQNVVPALGHVWGDWTVTLEPTYTDEGSRNHTCDRCGHTEVEAIPVLGHNHDLAKTNAVAPTCTQNGNINYWQCTLCHKYFSDEGNTEILLEDTVVDLLGHDYVDHAAVAPTCTVNGCNAYVTCSRCDYTTYSEVAALGHDYQHHTAQAATCTEHGWGEFDTCSRCDHSTYQEISALGHAYSATYEWSADGKICIVHIVCANDAAHNHDVSATVTSAVKSQATYSDNGVTTYSVSGTYDGFAYASSKDVADIVYEAKADESGVKTYEESLTADETKDVTGLFSAAKTEEGRVEFIANTEAGALTIEFDNSAVNAIGSSGNPVTIKANVVKDSTAVADAKLVIEVTLSEKFENGKAKVSVPFTEAVPEGKVVKVYFINGDVREDMNATLVDGKVVFETNHFSTYAVFFEDVPSSSGSNGGGFPIWIVFVIIAVVAAAGVGAFFVVKNKKA